MWRTKNTTISINYSKEPGALTNSAWNIFAIKKNEHVNLADNNYANWKLFTNPFDFAILINMLINFGSAFCTAKFVLLLLIFGTVDA